MSKYNLRAVLSDRCNYRCVFCSHDFNRCRNRDIPPGFMKECLKVFASLGGEKVAYSGGEPLIFPYLQEIMRLSKFLGLKNAITTNGSMLPFQSEEFYSLADSLNISVPSFVQEEYERLTSSGCKVEDIIRNAVKASEYGLRVKINMVYARQDTETVKHAADILAPHGIIIKLMNDMKADEEYYHDFLELAETFRGDSRIEVESAKNPGLNMCRECNFTHPNGCPSCRSLWVYPDGRITLCPFDDAVSFLDSVHDDILECIRNLMNRS